MFPQREYLIMKCCVSPSVSVCLSVCPTLDPRPVCQPASHLKVLQGRLTPSNMFKHGRGGDQERSGGRNKRVESVTHWLCRRWHWRVTWSLSEAQTCQRSSKHTRTRKRTAVRHLCQSLSYFLSHLSILGTTWTWARFSAAPCYLLPDRPLALSACPSAQSRWVNER